MIYLIIGFLFTLIFFLLLVLTIGYTVFLWESNRVDNLASTIRREQDLDILSRSSVDREFTSFDLNRSLAKTKNKAGQIYSNTLVAIKDHNYPDWVNKLRAIVKGLRYNTWQTIKKFFSYLHNLTKPIEKEVQEIKEKQERDRHQEIIDETVEKVIKANSSVPIIDYGLATDNVVEDGIVINLNKQEENNMVSGSDQATLGFASGAVVDEDNKEMSLFEKLEARVLTKLKEGGMDNYDIWLELGDLYLKFDEKQKAREVYALVLKHAEGKAKEMARNRLIGLS